MGTVQQQGEGLVIGIEPFYPLQPSWPLGQSHTPLDGLVGNPPAPLP
jgi:hypothetical protein